jgi:hypothetical protein
MASARPDAEVADAGGCWKWEKKACGTGLARWMA